MSDIEYSDNGDVFEALSDSDDDNTINNITNKDNVDDVNNEIIDEDEDEIIDGINEVNTVAEPNKIIVKKPAVKYDDEEVVGNNTDENNTDENNTDENNTDENNNGDNIDEDKSNPNYLSSHLYVPSISYIEYKIPTRLDFIDHKLAGKMDNIITAKQEIYFLPNYISEHDEILSVRNDHSNKYRIYLYGILLDGRKIVVIVENYPLYVDIEIPESMTEKEFNRLLDIKLTSTLIDKRSVIKLYPFGRFSIDKIPYLRITFRNSFDRGKIIRELKKSEFTFASNDDNNYLATYIRNHKLNGCGWNKIDKYECVKQKQNNQSLIDKKLSYIFYVSYNNVLPVADSFIENIEKTVPNINSAFSKNKTLLMTLDIETLPFEDTGEAPATDLVSSYIITTIGMSFHWYYDPQPLKQICLTLKESYSRSTRDTVYCKTEKELLTAFIDIYSSMSPDILTHFNGGSFDTPAIFYKLKQHGLLMQAKKSMCYKQNYKDSELGLGQFTMDRYRNYSFMKVEMIKITADENVDIKKFALDGVIEIDVMPMMKQIYPKVNVGRAISLNKYLAMNNLPSKEDMPIKTMFKILKTASSPKNLRDVDLVCEYCVVDAISCQRLLCKQTVIDDKREIANQTYLGLYEGVFRANGMKIKNLMASKAHERGIAFSNISKDKDRIEMGKYPGAYVFYPKRGWHTDRPITGLDFASLYPSLMMAYNLSTEKLVKDEKMKIHLETLGYTFKEVKFNFNNIPRKGWFVWHENNLDFDNGDGNVSNKKEVKDEKNNEKKEEKKPKLKNVNMGLFPSILIDLFNDRAIYKKKFNNLSAEKEHLEVEMTKHKDDKEEMDKLNRAYSDVCFQRDKVNSKQKGKKVLMNTFYGESGNKMSPLFELLVACGTTTMGVYNIKLVASFLTSYGCRIVYGDTDSVYVKCPERVFEVVDQEYHKGSMTHLEYWTKMVEITMVEMQKIRNMVNDMLAKDNGTNYLKMAYEEVLFPAMFHGKKFYSGIPHENVPNFYPKDVFKRGGEYVKGGRSALLYKICNKFLEIRYNPENYKRENLDIVLELLKNLYTENWDSHLFKKMAKYKPHKKNVSVLTFIERVKKQREKYEHNPELQALYPMPEPGDIITTIVIRPTVLHDIKGKKLKLSIGDRMEYLEVFNYYNQKEPGVMKIDLEYYLSSGIINTFARFICHLEQFQPPELQISSLDENAQNQAIEEHSAYIDDFSCKAAEKYIYDYCATLSGNSKEVISKQNSLFKKIYKKTIGVLDEYLHESLKLSGAVSLIHNDNIEMNCDEAHYFEHLMTNLDIPKLQEESEIYCKKLLKKSESRGITIYKLRQYYKTSMKGESTMYSVKVSYLKKQMESLITNIKKKISAIVPIIHRYDNVITDTVMDMRTNETTEFNKETLKLTDDQLDLIESLYKDYQKYKIYLKQQFVLQKMILHINTIIDKVVKPSNVELNKIIITSITNDDEIKQNKTNSISSDYNPREFA